MSIFGTGTDAIPIPKFIYALRIWEGNKYVDFQEYAGGAELTAELEDGWYLPDDLASLVAQVFSEASSGASGASAIYSCSFDRSTDMFTISKTASGASSYANNRFDILFNSGTSTASGAGSALGYSVASDATGASAYEADNELPNRLIPSQPIREPFARFEGLNRSAIAESGIFSSRHIRTDIRFEFAMIYIPENEVKDEWAKWMGKVDEVEGAWLRQLDFEFYPKATNQDYIVLHPDESDWDLREMHQSNLPAFYEWRMSCRETIPKAGTWSLADIYTRIP